MHKLPVCLSAFLALALAACGGSTAAAINKDEISQLETINATLDTVKDEASAKAAAPKLGTVVTTLHELRAKIKAMDPKTMDPNELKTLNEGPKAEQLKKLQANVQRIKADPQMTAALKDALDKLN